jgi:putative nucleotidyltransferase with HDIG domain
LCSLVLERAPPLFPVDAFLLCLLLLPALFTPQDVASLEPLPIDEAVGIFFAHSLGQETSTAFICGDDFLMPIHHSYTSKRDYPDKVRKSEEGKLLVLEVLELPTLSVILNKILKVASNGKSGASDMAEVISRDQALTANILKIANSAYFGLSQKVTTIPRAIVVLGFDAIKSIALSASVIEVFRQNSHKNHFDRSKFWTHSLACAYVSKKIAAMTHRAQLETGFVCGLLHDIGKIVLDIYFPDSYQRVLERLADRPSTSTEAEDEMLGFTHAEVGMWLAQRWKFPKAIVFSIANHHGMIADDVRYRSLTSIIRLANHLCLEEGLCLANQALAEPLEDSLMGDIKLEPSDLIQLRETLSSQADSFIALFSSWD